MSSAVNYGVSDMCIASGSLWVSRGLGGCELRVRSCLVTGRVRVSITTNMLK